MVGYTSDAEREQAPRLATTVIPVADTSPTTTFVRLNWSPAGSKPIFIVRPAPTAEADVHAIAWLVLTPGEEFEIISLTSVKDAAWAFPLRTAESRKEVIRIATNRDAGRPDEREGAPKK